MLGMAKYEPYPSDFTEAEWKLIRPLLPEGSKLGRPPRYARRDVVEAIFYVVRGGIGWRMLPRHFPPWRIVYYYYFKWREQGHWQRIHQTLVERKRLAAGKKKAPRLRSSTARALKHLTTEECAATMRERRSPEGSDIFWWIRWD